MNYEDKISALVERAIEKRNESLYDLIHSENLEEYEPGTLTILEGDELNHAIVPCKEFMILVRDRWDGETSEFISEYAIYSQRDHDDHPIMNAMNANATYVLEYVGEETFENMAAAIKYACDLIYDSHGQGEQWMGRRR